MRHRLKFSLVTLSLAASLAGSTALADSLALVVTNTAYADATVGNGPQQTHALLLNAYRAQGFEVIEGRDLTGAEMRSLLDSFVARMDDKDRLVIHYTGRAASFGQNGWLLPVDTPQDALVDVAYDAAPVGLLLDLLAEAPGHSAMIFADTGGDLSYPLGNGLGDGAIPQGVLLLSGPEKQMNDFVMQDLLFSTEPVAKALLRADNTITIGGFASADVTLAPETGIPAPTTGTPPSPLDSLTAEQSLWSAAEKSGKAADYQAYLQRYPNGIFATSAHARLDALAASAAPTPKDIEDALGLKRSDKRKIQADLTLLGYNTRGVDGIFGRGTRGAIGAWQKAQHLDPTGYLDAEQLAALAKQAGIRRAVIEQQDNRYWNATGLSGSKEDLQLYLDKYPNGLHAAEAKEALAKIEAAEKEQADTAAWTEAVGKNTADSYRAYLADFPDGIYAEIAKDRVKALDPDSLLPDEEQAAKDAEARLGLNPATRLLIESRLKGLGFNPGIVDGVFTATTRAAIKAYQKDRGIPASGYVDSATVRALLMG